MNTREHKEANYQCIECGNIHLACTDKVIDLCDNIYYATVCPHCRDVTKHLWVGENDDDKYLWMDTVLDSRYY